MPGSVESEGLADYSGSPEMIAEIMKKLVFQDFYTEYEQSKPNEQKTSFGFE